MKKIEPIEGHCIAIDDPKDCRPLDTFLARKISEIISVVNELMCREIPMAPQKDIHTHKGGYYCKAVFVAYKFCPDCGEKLE